MDSDSHTHIYMFTHYNSRARITREARRRDNLRHTPAALEVEDVLILHCIIIS